MENILTLLSKGFTAKEILEINSKHEVKKAFKPIAQLLDDTTKTVFAIVNEDGITVPLLTDIHPILETPIIVIHNRNYPDTYPSVLTGKRIIRENNIKIITADNRNNVNWKLNSDIQMGIKNASMSIKEIKNRSNEIYKYKSELSNDIYESLYEFIDKSKFLSRNDGFASVCINRTSSGSIQSSPRTPLGSPRSSSNNVTPR